MTAELTIVVPNMRKVAKGTGGRENAVGKLSDWKESEDERKTYWQLRMQWG